MNRPGGISGLVDTLLGIFGVHLPAWGASAGVVLIAVILLPVIYRNQSTARARRLLTAAFATSSAVERDRLEAEAIAVVGRNPDGLAALAEIALERGRRPLARTLVRALAVTGARPLLVRRYEQALDPDLPATPEDAVIRICLQREASLHVAAEELLSRALVRWPDHVELRALSSGGPPAR